MEKIKKIVITGGGSGGHVSVASGLIDAIKDKYPELYQNLIYIGGDLGMVGEDYGNSLEQRRFKNADFETKYIRAGKLQRTFSFTSIKLFLRTFLGIIDSFKILNKEKPDLIFSTGGFVSVPVCLVAWMKRIPVYIHEQTATVGLSNRIVGRFAKKIYIAFESSKKYFKVGKTKLVGNIVREAITEFKVDEVNEEIRQIFTNNTRYPLIYISGGGLGSHMINSKVLAELESLLSKYRVILQTGDNQTFKDYEKAVDIRGRLPEEKRQKFLPIKYISDKSIGYVYHNMDIFLGRAGANTVYEIGVLAKPSIFVPIPWVTNNEQYENAKALENAGLSEIVEEEKFKETNLKSLLETQIHKLPEEDLNAEALKRQFPTDAVEKVLNDLYT
jgi:UDP-N-acetylglucosamine--N-acetylmuramyl-(pentapeptide) pyrophosphoryl-undecaprenol N-acetylglucosamine transferase